MQNYGNYNPYGFQNFGGYPNYQQQNQQQVYTQPAQNPQPSRVAFSYIQGVEGAKAFYVQPNTTVILRDSESNLLFEKVADQQGRTTMKTYELIEVGAKPKVEYVTLSEFESAIKEINKKLGVKGAKNE